MRQREKLRGPVAQSERNSDDRYRHNSHQNGAADPPDHQNRDKDNPQCSEEHLGIGNFAQPHECRLICDDDFRVPKSNEGDENSDSGGRTVLQAIGNAVHDLFADIG